MKIRPKSLVLECLVAPLRCPRKPLPIQILQQKLRFLDISGILTPTYIFTCKWPKLESEPLFLYSCNIIPNRDLNVTDAQDWTGPLACLSLSFVMSQIRSGTSIWKLVFPSFVFQNIYITVTIWNLNIWLSCTMYAPTCLTWDTT